MSLFFKTAVSALPLVLLSACTGVDSYEPSPRQAPHPRPSAERVVHSVAPAQPVVQPVAEPQPHPVTPIAARMDFWSHLRLSFSLDLQDDIRRPAVQTFIRRYQKHPKHLAKVTTNAEPFLYHIKQAIIDAELPPELTLLPFVESAYEPTAMSKDKALGLWQIIPSTGKHLGLQSDWWFDGRRDLDAATNAALRYLTELHNEFDDWLLALAAYNCGEGTVRRAIKRNRARGLKTTFWDLRLPKETRLYVPKFLAWAAIVENPSKYRIELFPIENKPFLQRVEVDSQLELSVAAKLAKVPLKQFYGWNAGYNRWATHPQGPYHIYVPTSKYGLFLDNLAALDAKDRVRWTRYRIKSGDSLSRIAMRFKTSIQAIKTSNNLKTTNIIAGNYLLIPRT